MGGNSLSSVHPIAPTNSGVFSQTGQAGGNTLPGGTPKSLTGAGNPTQVEYEFEEVEEKVFADRP